VPDKIGEYRIKANVTGNLSGGYERTIKAEEKEHHYSSWKITKKASCTQTGIQTRICSICNKTQTETIPASAHTLAKDKSVAATCTKEGQTEGAHCSVCGKVIIAQKAIPAIGHTYNSGWKSNANYHWIECECGEKDKVTTHTFKWVTDVSATFTATGKKHEVCSICGYCRNYNTIIDKIVPEQSATPKPTLPPAFQVEPVVTPEPTAFPAVTAKPVATIEPIATPIVLEEPVEEPMVTPVISEEPVVSEEPIAAPVISEEPIDAPTEVPSGEQIDLPLISSNPVNEPSVNDNQNTGKIGKVKITWSVSRKKGKVYLKWKNIKGADGYQIQYSRKRTFLKNQTKSTKKSSITLKGLSSKKKYYIRIRAYSQKKTWKYGKWSKVGIVKIK